MSSGSPTTQSAKHHRVDFWKIVAWAGLLLAGAVHMVDPLDLFSSSVVPISLVAADSDAPEPAAIEISVTSDSATTKNEGFVQLLGMDTEPVDDGALLDKWRRVRADITKDLEIIAQCRAGKSCPASAQRLISLSLEGYGRSDRARVGLLHSNSGDCEDYAIFKYAALLADGVSKDAVKIVMLRNRLPNEDCAVVAVRVDNQWFILDNRTLAPVRDTDVRRAIPEFVLDDKGVSRFVDRNPKAVS